MLKSPSKRVIHKRNQGRVLVLMLVLMLTLVLARLLLR